MENLTISLPPEIIDSLRAAVAGGDYASVNEAVREALGDWHSRRHGDTLQPLALRHLVQAGIDSGPGVEADVVFAGLRNRFSRP